MKTNCYYIHSLTALHSGTGQGTGVIDLPVAREKSTGLPIVPGSGIKGVLREELRPDDRHNEEDRKSDRQKLWEALFGPTNIEAESDGGFAGALSLQDAQLLCLPVRSISGVFAWVSCPFVLRRYDRDLQQTTGSVMSLPDTTVSTGQALTTSTCRVKDTDRTIFLEDLEFQADEFQADEATAEIDGIARHIAGKVFPLDEVWQKFFQERFMIVSDDVFSFLAETATDVRARIRMEEGKRTVRKGALWYEENLPAETILWGVIGCDRSRNESYVKRADTLMNDFTDSLLQGDEVRLQIGGNATVGCGNVRWILEPLNNSGGK